MLVADGDDVTVALNGTLQNAVSVGSAFTASIRRVDVTR
jgi:hypothetical protein